MQTEIPEDVMKAAREAVAQDGWSVDGDSAYCDPGDSVIAVIDILPIARAIMAERERSQWLPIETAPQDGTGILAYNPLMGVYNTAYQKNEPDERDRWPCGFSGFLGKWYCWPTHWMPKPSPPKQEA